MATTIPPVTTINLSGLNLTALDPDHSGTVTTSNQIVGVSLNEKNGGAIITRTAISDTITIGNAGDTVHAGARNPLESPSMLGGK